jgi:hypothetical protein
MQLEKDLVDNEVERLEILFEKNEYNDDQKRWFIESKFKDAKDTDDKILLKVCEILLDKLEQKKEG